MNKFIRVILLALSCWGTVGANASPILSFDASSTDVNKNYMVGEQVQLELWVSGLTSLDLAGFDLTLHLDPAITSYQSTLFAPELTDQDFILLDDWLINPSELNLSGVSLAPDLSGQADAFRIATLAFTAIGAGNSWISFNYSLLSDEFAAPFATTNFGASITVNASQVTVPEPSPLLLMLSLVFALRLRYLTKA